jgi:transposase
VSGEIIIDGKRKRSWPKELKRQIVSESDAEGVTVCEVARRYDIEPSQLFHWRKQFRDDAGRPARAKSDHPAEFFPIEVAAPDVAGNGKFDADGAGQPITPLRAEIAFPNGRRLFVAPGLDQHSLNALIAAVGS